MIKDSWKNILTNSDNLIKTINATREIFKPTNLKIFPTNETIFNAFNYFEFNQTKVVIIGQDPYHGEGQATGLAFGIEVGNKIPPSLRNISNELKNDLNIDLNDITLSSWAKQGILLLNASLTVIEGKPGSHMKIWSEFTDNIINELNKLDNIVFVAWGAFAHNKLKNVDVCKHKIIVSSHPSPLSCNKKYGEFPQFKESKPFSKINEYLISVNKDVIKW